MTTDTAPKARVKNPCGKARPESNPYAVYQNVRSGITYRVLKVYSLKKDPFARVFLSADGPFTGGMTDMGDDYIDRTIDAPGSVRVQSSPEWDEFLLLRK